MEETKYFCPYCGYNIIDYCKTKMIVFDSVRFCPNCGKRRITYKYDK